MTKHISYIRILAVMVAGLLTAVWLGGCTRENDHVEPESPLSMVTITVNVPDTRTPSTRSMVGDGEDKVQSIDLLVFDATDPDNEIFLQWVEGKQLNQDFDEALSTVTFTAELKPTDVKSRIVVVANNSLSSLVSGFTAGVTKKAAVMEALTYATSGSAPADWAWKTDYTGNNYTAIPMYGEKVLTKISAQMSPVTGIELVRMLARIDVKTTASNFTTEAVYLINYNTAGYISPAFNETTGQIIDPSPDAPQIPANNGKKTGESNAITYTISGAASYEGYIYAYESPAAVDGSTVDETSRKDAACLVVKGKIDNGTSYYYRVDFTSESAGTYLGLKRNYKYIIDIQQAEGIGYTSISDALDAYSVLSNLKTRVIYYDRAKIKDMVYNGQHMLGVGQTSVTLNKFATSYTVDVFTDNPNGWTATISDSDAWLVFGGDAKTTSGAANEDTSLTFWASAFNGAESDSRTAVIALTADRLSYKITVTQTRENPTFLRVEDEYGNPVDELFFPLNSGVGDPDVPAQTVYVIWDGPICQVELNSGGYMEFETLDPAFGRGNGAQFSGGIQAITIQPKKGGYVVPDKSDGSWYWDMVHIYVFDESYSVLRSASINMNQGALTFNAVNLRNSGYPLGSEYTLQVQSNALWTIKSVTATGAALDDLLVSGGDLRVGKTGGIANDVKTDNLTFTTGQWAHGVSGTIQVLFELAFADVSVVFNRTIEIPVHSNWLNYAPGNSIAPRYYMYPSPIGGIWTPTLFTLAQAEAKCASIGAGWRVPTASELHTAFAYQNALGGYGTEIGWSWPQYWSTSYLNDGVYLTVQGEAGWGSTFDPGDTSNVSVRCVYPNSTGKLYPYVESHADGTVIVSRDTDGGIDMSALFGDNETVTGSTNKVAQKLLVSNSYQYENEQNDWEDAKTLCPTGWRMPTQREAYLIWGMGGVTLPNNTVTNPGFGGDIIWPGAYNHINSAIWTVTETVDDDNDPAAWVFSTHNQENKPEMSKQKQSKVGGYNWINLRCVKSLKSTD